MQNRQVVVSVWGALGILVFGSILGLVGWPAFTEALSEDVAAERWARKQAPNLWAAWGWSYPDDVWDPAEVDAAYHAAVHRGADADDARDVDGTWTQQGPLNLSGRINVIAQDPSAPERMYIGAAGGGLWRSVDAGLTWESSTEALSHLAIGALAIHPVDNDILFLGTGDPQISGHPRIGNGVYKSTDGGQSWTHLGLTEQRIVSKLAIHPQNPDVIFAATMGNPALPGPDRGLYRSMDGGDTWEQVLFVADSVGINDVAISTTTGAILATSWHRIRTSTVSDLVSPANRVYRSTDAGTTWEMLPNPWGNEERCRIGLEAIGGRITVNPVGADMQFSNLYRTNDDGDTWQEVVPEGAMPENIYGGFGWYFSKVRVNPWDPADITVLGVDAWNTLDGGQTWERLGPEWWTYEVHADKHDMQWVGPNELLLATDGGAYRSVDHGQTWQDIEDLPIGQFYRVTHIPTAPGWFTAGAQDNGTSTGNVLVDDAWTRDRGGDGFTPLYHPENPALRVATVQYANFAYSETAWNEEPDWVDFNAGMDSEDREGWDAPILFHPADPSVAWCATNRVYRMVDAPYGTWGPASEDLTLNEAPGLSFRVVTALAGHPTNPDVVAAGTSDGRVWVTTSGGQSWIPMSEGLPVRMVTDVAFDPFFPDTLTVALNGYKDAIYTPHLYRAVVGGTWTPATGDLPNHPINDWRALNDSTWVVATDFGVYHSESWGSHWERVGDMPFIPVYELDVDTASSQLVAATFARSIQTFPLDSLLAPEVVVEPKDTTTIGVASLGSAPCFEVWGQPVRNEARVWWPNAFEGGTWTLWTLEGRHVANGHIQAGLNVLMASGWPRGVLVLEGNAPGDTHCSGRLVRQ